MVPSFGFMVMGLVSGLSLASHLAHQRCLVTQGPSWWCARDSANVDSNVRASGKLAGCFVSPLRLLALPEFLQVCSLASPPSFYPEFSPFVSGGSSVFLVRPSVMRQFRHAVTVAPAKAGGFHPWWPHSGKRASKQSEKIREDILEEVRFGLRF